MSTFIWVLALGVVSILIRVLLFRKQDDEIFEINPFNSKRVRSADQHVDSKSDMLNRIVSPIELTCIFDFYTERELAFCCNDGISITSSDSLPQLKHSLLIELHNSDIIEVIDENWGLIEGLETKFNLNLGMDSNLFYKVFQSKLDTGYLLLASKSNSQLVVERIWTA